MKIKRNNTFLWIGKRLLIVLFFISVFHLNSSKALELTCNIVLDSSPKTIDASAVSEIDLWKDGSVLYSESYGVSGKFLRLNRQEYKERVLNESIEFNSILILDEIDLEVDLPLVAGLIISKPLLSYGSHIQDLCEKMGIPFIYIPKAYEDSLFKDLNTKGDFVTLDTRHNKAKLLVSEDVISELNRVSKLPGDYLSERYVKHIVGFNDYMGLEREAVGDKFFPLARLEHDGYLDLNEMLSLKSSFFYHFLNKYQYKNKLLKDWINDTQKANQEANEKEIIANNLSSLREAIIKAIPAANNNLNEFKSIQEEIIERLGISTDNPLSIRSNNDVEDLIAAGAYESIKTKDASVKEIELAVKKVFASMFTVRAKGIRDAWGLREENLRMPILIHEYLDNEEYNGNGKFFLKDNGRLEAVINLVKGSGSKATNPSLDSKTISVKFRIGNNDEIILDQVLSQNYESTNEEDAELYDGLTSFIDKLRPYIKKHFLGMEISPDIMEIEFAAFKNDNQKDLEFKLLQYKHRYPLAVVDGVLSGEIDREKLDSEIRLTRKGTDGALDGIDAVSKAMGARPLHSISQKALASRYHNRFALVKIAGKYEIIIWQEDLHTSFKAKLQNNFPNVKWIRSGYLMSAKNGLNLEFQMGTLMKTDLGLNPVKWFFPDLFTKKAFVKALNNAYTTSRAFATFVDEIRGEIVFEGFKQNWNFSKNQLIK